MLLFRNVIALLFSAALASSAANVVIGSNDVVAFVGGTDVAAAQFTGHAEALLTVAYPGARFRNFGWEGDTVFAQPRDVGFPPLSEHLKRAGVTVVFLQYGRAEALGTTLPLTNFIEAYEKILGECLQQTRRVVLVTSPLFERPPEPLPDLSRQNRHVIEHNLAIRVQATRRQLPMVDLQNGVSSRRNREALTDDGLLLTPRGHAILAGIMARQLGFKELADRAGAIGKDGAWSNPEFERLRRLVIAKNQLWFNYWRPQNWAFLGGDRVSQPSSRDHRDPKVRWFPAEMEKFLPLIREKEEQMAAVAAPLRQGEGPNLKTQIPTRLQ